MPDPRRRSLPHRPLLVLLLLAASWLGASPALAWGPIGHRVIGRIAENHLNPDAARAIAELIGPETVSQVGFWADQMRSDPAYRHTAPWHYVNFEGDRYEDAEKNPGGDVIEAVGRFIAILRDPAATRESKQVALRFLVHMVGDIHQPLHIGRADDRGGNSVEVTWHGEPTNLHRMWDSHLIDAEKLSFSEYAAFLDHATPAEVAAWQGTELMVWVLESKALLPQVYDIGNGELGYAYQYQSRPILQARLLQGGVRLAGLLNALFGPVTPLQCQGLDSGLQRQ